MYKKNMQKSTQITNKIVEIINGDLETANDYVKDRGV